MTDRERLEEIKQDVKMVRKYLAVSPSNETTLNVGILLNSMDYLIERVQELEDIIYQDARQDVIEGLYEENKRYREVLRKIIKEGENGEYSHYTAQRALEEKTDE